MSIAVSLIVILAGVITGLVWFTRFPRSDRMVAVPLRGCLCGGRSSIASIGRSGWSVDDHADLLALLDCPRPGNLHALLALQRAFSRKDEQR